MEKGSVGKIRAIALGATLASAITIVGGATPAALAATPTVKGCLGESISTAAGPGFGNFIEQAAQDPADRPGLGDAVQAAQAGRVPDAAFPNTCN
jgi:hypothetical protein